jgi:hypothetical protein
VGKVILVTRPEHDITTRYISKWSEKVIDEARSKGHDVVDLDGAKATRERFIGTLKKKSPKLLILNGHGNQNWVSGYNDEPILLDSDDAVEGKIIYARSCQSAKKLGKASVSFGAAAFLGYDEDFVFLIDETKTARPLEDKTAELFLEPSNYLPISILKGHSAEIANKRSKNLFSKNIEKLLITGPSNEDYYAIRYLLWDMRHQVRLGDSNAVL